MISVCPASWAGVVSAFRHLEGTFGIRFVAMEEVRTNPRAYASEDVLLGGGYHEYYDQIIAGFSGRKFFRFESPLTQMELSVAGRIGQPCDLGVELRQLLKLKRLVDENKVRLFVPSPKAAAVLAGTGEYWPNVVDERLVQTRSVPKTPDACGLFCEYYPRKNLATALFAVKLMGKQVWCARTIPDLYVDLAREFDIPMVRTSRLPELPYWSLLSSLELNLQVSLTEAFNYAAVESILCGTVPLVSTAVPFAGRSREFDDLCVVRTIDDPQEIACKGLALTKDPEAYAAALAEGRKVIQDVAEENRQVVAGILSDLGISQQSRDEFPEGSFPCPDEQRAEHERRMSQGRERMRQRSVVICGLARDAERTLPDTAARIEKLGRMFLKYRVIVYENDSSDNTKELLRQWQQRNSAVCVLSESCGDPRWRQERNLTRADRMAYYRNQYLAEVLRHHAGFDYLVMVDTDLSGGWSYEGVANTFGHDSWDMVGSNGILYHSRLDDTRPVHFDAWAFRDVGHERAHPHYEINARQYSRGQALMPVWSCFGGLAVYRMEALRSGCTYGGGDCEHVILHRQMRERGFGRLFMNPSQIVLY